MSGKLKVQIAEGRIVYVDGEARHAGELVELSEADARTLIAAGNAVPTTAAARKPRARKAKPAAT